MALRFLADHCISNSIVQRFETRITTFYASIAHPCLCPNPKY
jgi:hypothetical protein